MYCVSVCSSVSVSMTCECNIANITSTLSLNILHNVNGVELERQTATFQDHKTKCVVHSRMSTNNTTLKDI